MSLYNYPLYYDIAFERDVSREISFFKECLDRWGPAGALRTLELGCGPAYHTRALAQLGFQATGIDICKEMVSYAAGLLAEEGNDGVAICGDMREFDLAEPVDLTICMMASAALMLTLDDMVKHLDSVRRNLHHGGLYIMELSHPRDLFVRSGERPTSPEWKSARGDVTIEMHWGEEADPVDPVREIHSWLVTADVRDGEKRLTLRYREDQAIWTAMEIEAAMWLVGGLELIGWFGAFDINQSLNNSRWSWRMIPVMRRLPL